MIYCGGLDSLPFLLYVKVEDGGVRSSDAGSVGRGFELALAPSSYYY